MKKFLFASVATWMLSLAPHAMADLIVPTGTTQNIGSISLGNSITFEYMYTNVVWAANTNYFTFNASVINPLLGSFPIGQFNRYFNSNSSGWMTDGYIDTSSGAGTNHELAFAAYTNGYPNNSATVLVRNIQIDGQSISAVPEPGTLSLLGAGLLALVMIRSRRRAA